MAEIRMEKKDRGGGLGWLWALIALLLIALLVWWFWPDADVEEPLVDETAVAVTEPIETEPLTTEPAMGAATIQAVLANPNQWLGQTFSGTFTVVEVATDRGFWIEENGNRLFAVVVDQPREEPVDINPGQQVRIASSTLRGPDYMAQVPGDQFESDTQTLLQQQQIYLVANESDIEIREAGQPQS